MDLIKLTLKKAQEMLAKKEVSGEELTRAFLKRTHELNPKLNAYLSIFENAPGGLPCAIKDAIMVESEKCTAGSKILENYVASYDATAVKKLRAWGASILGKANCDEFTMGSTGEYSAFGVTLNPFDETRVAGGSSSGSAAAVAAEMALFSLGTDTGGSIRLPAAWCGVVGLKPTYGRVSRYGIIAMGSSWDCPGPITQTVEDAALLLEILAGVDRYDDTSISIPVEKWSKLLKTEKKLTIGYADEYFKDVDPEIMASVENAMHALEDRGHTLKKITMLDPKYAISVYMILQRAEVSSNLARYTGVRYGMNRTAFGKEAKKRIILGAFV